MPFTVEFSKACNDCSSPMLGTVYMGMVLRIAGHCKVCDRTTDRSLDPGEAKDLALRALHNASEGVDRTWFALWEFDFEHRRRTGDDPTVACRERGLVGARVEAALKKQARLRVEIQNTLFGIRYIKPYLKTAFNDVG